MERVGNLGWVLLVSLCGYTSLLITSKASEEFLNLSSKARIKHFNIPLISHREALHDLLTI